jgi:hypothetical protein
MRFPTDELKTRSATGGWPLGALAHSVSSFVAALLPPQDGLYAGQHCLKLGTSELADQFGQYAPIQCDDLRDISY